MCQTPGRRVEQPPLKLPGIQFQRTSRCSSCSSSIRTSRSQARESSQTAASTSLTSPKGLRSAGFESSDLLFEKRTRGYDRGRTPLPTYVVVSQNPLAEDCSASPCSGQSIVLSISGSDRDFSISRSLSRPKVASRLGSAPRRDRLLEPPSRAREASHSRPSRSKVRVSPLDIGDEPQADDDVKTQRLLSALLARRTAISLDCNSPARCGTPARGSTPARRGRLAKPIHIDIPSTEKTIRQLNPNEKIFDLYHWSEVIQEEGDGGKVVVCKPKSPSRLGSKSFVMKIRSKESLVQQRYLEQFRQSTTRLLNLPRHEGVMEILEALEDEKFFYIVMEKAEGGSLFRCLLTEFKDGVMPATAVRKLMREILEAVSHVHKQGILHRDIKPDNLVMQVCHTPQGKTMKAALIDFDHADPEWDPRSPGVHHNEFCGTVQFSAPEACTGYFSQSSDLYSVGVILYLLMTGKMPFSDDIYAGELRRRKSASKFSCGSSKAAEQMQAVPIDWECNPWSEQLLCRSFCKSLLAADPLLRPSSAEEALAHPWFSAQE